MKKSLKVLLCLFLVLTMLSSAGCRVGTAGFGIVLANIEAADAPARESAAKTAKGFSELGFTERLFSELYEDGENLAYSPVSVFLALAMLAETSAGETRAEILSALGAESIEEAREIAKALLISEIFKEKTAECSIANSIWLRDGVDYDTDTLGRIAEVFATDSFSGDASDPAYSKALREWLDKKTNGLLKDSVKDVRLDPQTVFAIVSTIYFSAEWERKFEKNDTRQGIFRSPAGEISCDLMHSSETLYYTEGEGFRAAGKPMNGGTVMWFILPDEGAGLETALPGIASLSTDDREFLNFAMPKLDATSDLDLIPVFEKLGIVSCMDPAAADFSPLLGARDGVYVNKAQHAARVMADEKCVKAAAFTLIAAKDSAAFSEKDFILDRPFLFVITGASGAPLFVGAINDPTA